jgi:predicted metal-dependent hydrolase
MSAFEYQLARSARRKTLSIVIRRGQVKVMAPAFLPSATIKAFIDEKSSWIQQKLQTQQGWIDQGTQQNKQFVDGELFYYLGEQYSLVISDATKSAVTLVGDQLFIDLSNRVKTANKAAFIQKLLQEWYKEQLNTYLMVKLGHFSQLMDVCYTGVNIRFYKRRWGSCSSKGQLSFNYVLMMAPSWVIDYVIVHELSHLRHLNHSAHFWAVVRRFYPSYKEATQWLKDNGVKLSLL